MFKTKIKILLSLAIIATSFLSLKAQKRYKFEYGGGLGFSNYLGEIGGGAGAARPFIADVKLAKTRWSTMGYMRYKVHPRIAIKASANYLRISGDDKLSANPGRRYRNLSFRNDMFDVEGTVQFMFIDKNKPVGIFSRFTNTYFSAYVFVGVGAYSSNPKAYYQGSWVNLRPLKTEGQSNPYSLFGVCVPMGVGCYFTVTRRLRAHRIGIEINWRYTNSDYLDDVSSDKWVNPALMSSSTAAALNNRNPELGNNQPAGMSGNYGWHDDGDGNNLNKAPRGNPKNKDSYFTVNFTYGVALKAHYTRSHGKKIRSLKF